MYIYICVYIYVYVYVYICIYICMYVSHNNPIISHYTTMFLGFGSPFLVDQLPKTKHPSIYKLVFPRFVHHIISYSNMFHVFSPYVPIISPMFPMGFFPDPRGRLKWSICRRTSVAASGPPPWQGTRWPPVKRPGRPGWQRFLWRTSIRFGTWISFFHILGISSSQLTFIFSRGVETTNQYIYIYIYI